MLHLVDVLLSVSWIIVFKLSYFSCTYICNVLSCFHVCIDCKILFYVEEIKNIYLSL